MSLLFFADRLPPLTGGVETHARYFIEHFTNHAKFPISAVVTKDEKGNDILIANGTTHQVHLHDIPKLVNSKILFFNSGRWIEDFIEVRKVYPHAACIYRTGGNEIIKAPLQMKNIHKHSDRQFFWVDHINRCIDLVITNSQFTEGRLKNLGLQCPFKRFVGGVDTDLIRRHLNQTTDLPLKKDPITLFCAARFVPYKNHFLLVSVVKELIERGYNIQLRLAGDGPLLDRIKEKVCRLDLNSAVRFLGTLANENACREAAQADIYIQLSCDQVTEVLGGSYIHSEGMGRSILEALSAGTFVIVGKSGALDEIVNNENGVLIDLNDTETVVNQIARAIDKRKRGAFSDRYSWSKIFLEYEEVFKAL